MLLTNSPYAQVEMTDKNGNGVVMYSRYAKLIADIRTDIDIICGLPDSYKVYTIHLAKFLKATGETAACMQRWSKAAEIIIHADNDVIYQLVAQSRNLLSLAEVHNFEFDLDQSSFSRINITDLMDNLPALQTIKLSTTILNADQIAGFVDRQGTLNEWVVEILNSGISYTKKIPKTTHIKV